LKVYPLAEGRADFAPTQILPKSELRPRPAARRLRRWSPVLLGQDRAVASAGERYLIYGRTFLPRHALILER